MIDKGIKKDKKNLELLYRSFDETLSEKQQMRLDEALNDSEELRRKDKLQAFFCRKGFEQGQSGPEQKRVGSFLSISEGNVQAGCYCRRRHHTGSPPLQYPDRRQSQFR